MIFDGIKFRHAPSYIVLHDTNEQRPGYVRFGKCVKPYSHGAKEHPYMKTRRGESVWYREVKIEGYSLTNMGYTATHVILAYDGSVFTAPRFRR